MASREFVDTTIAVRAPATSANLGPGFDALGLALSWHDGVEVRVTGSELAVEVTGEGAESVVRDETHLVVRSMLAAFDAIGVGQPAGLVVRCHNRIPHGRGLGSSAAAIVTGIVAARALVSDGPERLDEAAALRLAAELEGHPDNVAACLLGGLTVAWADGDGARALTVSPDVRVVAMVPPHSVSTEAARGLLPELVPHADAARNAGRAALLVAALTSYARPDVLLAATDDRLHQTYRAPAMPDSYSLVQRLRADGIAAIISGAGPTVVALLPADADPEAVRGRTPDGWRCLAPGVDARGAHLRE
ncbi:MAG TPA: homoserine kinase [Nocardioidaceae bacterium]|nr:homoserine kinase [Nocardioidaceae bacterium]